MEGKGVDENPPKKWHHLDATGRRTSYFTVEPKLHISKVCIHREGMEIYGEL